MAVDPNIKQKADRIRTEIYGQDVRESLASGIEEMSEDVVENTGRQDHVEEQFQEVIENTTDKDVISAPEIIAARNGEPNLKARIDKDHQEVTAQLAQKVNRGDVSVYDIDKNKGKLDQTYMTDEFLQQVAGNAPINSVPADDSITLDKVAFKKVSTNLYNPEDTQIGYGISSISGAVTESGSSQLSGYIPISENQSYYIAIARTVVFFDEEKNFLSGILPDPWENYVAVTPSNAAFMRVAWPNPSPIVQQVNLGGEKQPYEPYYKYIEQKYIERQTVLEKDIPDGTITETKTSFAFRGKNLFDPEDMELDHALSYITGRTYYELGQQVSGFISVEPGIPYSVNKPNQITRIAFYDKNKLFLSYVFPVENPIRMPENCRYVRFSVPQGAEEGLQFEEGDKVTPYERYGFTIPKLLNKTQKAVTIMSNKHQEINFDTLKIQWHGQVLIDNYLYTPENQVDFSIHRTDEVQLIYYNEETNRYELHLVSENHPSTDLYYVGAVNHTSGFVVMNTPFQAIKGGKTYTNYIEIPDNTNTNGTGGGEFVGDYRYTPAYGMPKYEKTTNYIDGIPQGLNHVYYSGKWFIHKEADKEYMGAVQKGQEIYFKINNASYVSLDVLDKSRESSTLSVKLDNSGWVRHQTNVLEAETIQVASDLDHREHYIRVMLSDKPVWNFEREEAFFFGGVVTDGDVEPIRPRNRAAMFIGDSITVRDYEENYVDVIADRLNLRPIRNAIAGTGILETGSRDIATTLEYVNNITSTIEDTHYHNVDLILLNIGTNDWNFAEEDFLDGYDTVLKRLQQMHPGVPIFCIVPFLQTHVSSIQQAVYQNPDSCVLLPTDEWNISTVDGTHPDAIGNVAAGENVADFLLRHFGRSYFIM